MAPVAANPPQFVPRSWFYLTGLSQEPPVSQFPPAAPEPHKNPSNACHTRGHPFPFALLGYRGQALLFQPHSGVMAARTWQCCPYVQNQEKAPFSSSFPHGASFSLENFISLASCPFACKFRLGLVPSTHQILRTGKNPTHPAEEEGLGRPRAVARGSGDQHDWQKYPKVFFTGVTVQCSPTANNEQQPGGGGVGGAEPGGNCFCIRALLGGPHCAFMGPGCLKGSMEKALGSAKWGMEKVEDTAA